MNILRWLKSKLPNEKPVPIMCNPNRDAWVLHEFKRWVEIMDGIIPPRDMNLFKQRNRIYMKIKDLEQEYDNF